MEDAGGFGGVYTSSVQNIEGSSSDSTSSVEVTVRTASSQNSGADGHERGARLFLLSGDGRMSWYRTGGGETKLSCMCLMAAC